MLRGADGSVARWTWDEFAALPHESVTAAIHASGMGMVVRCPSCDAVVLRIARPRKQLWLDLTGVKLVVIP